MVISKLTSKVYNAYAGGVDKLILVVVDLGLRNLLFNTVKGFCIDIKRVICGRDRAFVVIIVKLIGIEGLFDLSNKHSVLTMERQASGR